MEQQSRLLKIGVGAATLLVSGLLVGFTGVMAGKPAGGAMKSPPFVLGPMVFVSNRFNIISGTPNGNEIWTMDANGTNPVRLTTNTVAEWEPQWSPDRTKIAFTRTNFGIDNAEIYVMDADGTNQVNLTDHPATDFGCSWSPSGLQIAFSSDRDGNREIYVMNADGTNVQRLTNNAAIDLMDAWSPDGTKIAFTSTRTGGYDIYTMNANGSGLKRLTNNPADEFEPAWSPDGTKMVYYRRHEFENLEIYIMKADGKQQTRLTNNYPYLDADPSWKPLPPLP